MPEPRFSGAEERGGRLPRSAHCMNLHVHAGLAELLDQDFLALHRILIGIADDLDRQPVLEAGLGEQLARLVGIMGIELGNRLVVGPMRLRQVHVGGLGETGERRLDEGHTVDREIEGLAHLDVVERRLRPVEEDLEAHRASAR